MDRRGSTCRHCQGKFHACSSCGLYSDWEYNYCREDCWRASEEYKMVRYRAELLVSKLDTETMDALRFLLDESDRRIPVLEEVWAASSGVGKTSS